MFKISIQGPILPFLYLYLAMRPPIKREREQTVKLSLVNDQSDQIK